MRPGSRLAAVAAVALAVVALAAPSAAPAPRQEPDETGLDLTLVSQTPTVEPGAIFELRFLFDEAIAGFEVVRLTVHDRVRSRSELSTSSAGTGLRRVLYTVDTPLAQLPPDAGGSLPLSVSLDPATDAGRALATPGVYPVELIARSSNRSVARLITHLIVRPPALQSSPPLSVAVVVSVAAPPTTEPGRSPLSADAIATTGALLDTITTGSNLATLAPAPETLEALAGASSPDAAALVEQMRVVATRQPVLALPYVPVSPDALAAAGIPAELAQQLEHGRAVQRDVLQVEATEGAWLAAPDLGARGLALLEVSDVTGVIVDAAQIDPATDGLLSLARPFLVVPPRERGRPAPPDRGRLDGFVQDARLAALLDEGTSPNLLASRVLAELAMLWFEQPGIARGVIVPIDRSVDPTTAQRILEGLQVATLFHPVPLDDVFTAPAALADASGDRVQRMLDPDGDASISTSDVARLRDLQGLRESVRSMMGDTSPRLAPIDAALLRTTALGLKTDERDAQLDAAREAIDAVTGEITAQERFTITLTAREGTVPLTIRNGTGGPVEVLVRLRGPRLELPGGDTMTLTLTEATTRRDIAVRTRTSGAIPLEVEVVSPDGRIVLATTRYSVRSTAVSGVGVFLSAGAGLFLVIWWARHWRQARRSAKLVASPHPPAHRPDD